MNIKFGFLTLVLILSLALLRAEPVFAQNTAGVGISPAIFNEKMEPGETRQFNIRLSNLSGVDQTYFISKRDISGVLEGGVPVFSTKPEERNGYEITDWIVLDKSEVFINANGESSLSFILNVPETATPGSHFGGIIVSVEAPEMRKSGASIGYEVANIISIRVAGDANDSARIRQFATSQFIYGSTNVEFEARVENEGNTLVTPVGLLQVHNMFGQQVANLKFNESQAGVYPKTSKSDGLRTYNITWKDEGLGFGRYEARLSLVYGDEGKRNTISSTASFWILPMNIIGPALIVLLVLLAILYISIKLYVRRSLAVLSAGSNRRLVRTRQRNQFPIVMLLASMLSVTALFLIVLLLLFA